MSSPRTRAKHLFDDGVDEVHVRDGGDLEIPGFAFAPVFTIWTTIEECLNPPIVWETATGTPPSRSARPRCSPSRRASARSSA